MVSINLFYLLPANLSLFATNAQNLTGGFLAGLGASWTLPFLLKLIGVLTSLPRKLSAS